MELRLVGWVANEPDGSVRCVAEGPRGRPGRARGRPPARPDGRDRRARSARPDAGDRAVRRVRGPLRRPSRRLTGRARCPSAPPPIPAGRSAPFPGTIRESLGTRDRRSLSVMESQPSVPRPPRPPNRAHPSPRSCPTCTGRSSTASRSSSGSARARRRAGSGSRRPGSIRSLGRRGSARAPRSPRSRGPERRHAQPGPRLVAPPPVGRRPLTRVVPLAGPPRTATRSSSRARSAGRRYAVRVALDPTRDTRPPA